MGWLDKFKRKQSSALLAFDPYDFGRFSDAFKAPQKYDIWDESILLFDEGKRFAAFKKFFEYLKNESGENVYTSSVHGSLTFSIIQGSKKLNGVITNKTVHIQAVMAQADSYPAALIIDLLQENYNMKFCKYAFTKSKTLVLVSYAAVKVTSPYKLYYTLKEIALAADKKDDLIFSKYGLENPVQNRLLPIARRIVCCQYIQTLFRKVLTTIRVGGVDTEKYPSALRYLLLATAYKIDFLVKPEGLLMDYLEKIDKLAFSGQSNNPNNVNNEIVEIYQKILTISEEKLMDELYTTNATFGLNPVIRSAQIRDTIYSELPSMDWYMNQGRDTYAMAIVDFVVGYLLFNFAVPPPCKALFLLYYRIREPSFFKEMGYEDEAFDESKYFANKVKKEIKKITKQYASSFPYIKTSLNILEFGNRTIFFKKYLEMIAEMNFTPK